MLLPLRSEPTKPNRNGAAATARSRRSSARWFANAALTESDLGKPPRNGPLGLLAGAQRAQAVNLRAVGMRGDEVCGAGAGA